MRIHSIIVFSIILINACSPRVQPYKGDQEFKSVTGIPNYASLEYWAAHPQKWDPSDSIASDLNDVTDKKQVDVFFLHPTTFTNEEQKIILNASIDDPYLNKKTDYTSILYQASVFNGSCNVYAPRYRQAHIQMYYEKDSAKSKKAFDTAYNDIKIAFEYYLQHYNRGFPIIIASHSQGTTHAKKLLREFFDTSSLQRMLVAAYVIGIPVEKNYFVNLEACKDSSSTGCVISWRTFREGYDENLNSQKDSSIIITNPISWNTNNILVDKQHHQGAVLYNFQKVFKHTHNTRIAGNMLWISKPKFPGSLFYKTSNYHAGDINLFYVNIRENVKRRIDSYIKLTSTGLRAD